MIPQPYRQLTIFPPSSPPLKPSQDAKATGGLERLLERLKALPEAYKAFVEMVKAAQRNKSIETQ
jgi:hypothetical protein